MFCPNCGSKLPDGAVFCSNCGTKVQEAPAEPVTVEPVAEPVTAEPVAEPVTEQPAAEAFTHEYIETAVQPAQEPVAQVVPDQAPADYMVVNIILCVASVLTCCGCLPIASLVTSIIGIVAGSACKKAIEVGDWATAAAKSKTGKAMWITSAIILGVSIIASIVLLVLGITTGMNALEDVINELIW